MEQLLERLRKVNEIFEKKNASGFSFDEISDILGNMMESNMYIVSSKGRLLGVHFVKVEDAESIHENRAFPEAESTNFLKIEETINNVVGDEAKKVFPETLTEEAYRFKKIHLIIPVYGGGLRLGTLVFCRYSPEYTLEDVILGEHVATIVGIEIERRRNKRLEEKRRKRQMALVALDGLTWSELQALYFVFQELGGDNDLVVASKIADREHITRSIIVNALKKIESAGIVETRSYGQKGTKVKVLNDMFREELEKKHIS